MYEEPPDPAQELTLPAPPEVDLDALDRDMAKRLRAAGPQVRRLTASRPDARRRPPGILIEWRRHDRAPLPRRSLPPRVRRPRRRAPRARRPAGGRPRPDRLLRGERRPALGHRRCWTACRWWPSWMPGDAVVHVLERPLEERRGPRPRRRGAAGATTASSITASTCCRARSSTAPRAPHHELPPRARRTPPSTSAAERRRADGAKRGAARQRRRSGRAGRSRCASSRAPRPPRSACAVPRRPATACRIVEAEGFDRQPCGGTHPRNTSEVGVVVVLGHERHKGGTRVRFVCGDRAVAAFHQRAGRSLDETSAACSPPRSRPCPRPRAACATRAAEADRRGRELLERALEGEARRLLAAAAAPGPPVVVATYDGWPAGRPAHARRPRGRPAPCVALLGSRRGQARPSRVRAIPGPRPTTSPRSCKDALAILGGTRRRTRRPRPGRRRSGRAPGRGAGRRRGGGPRARRRRVKPDRGYGLLALAVLCVSVGSIFIRLAAAPAAGGRLLPHHAWPP